MPEFELILKTVSEGLKAMAQGIESLAGQIDSLSQTKVKPKPSAKPASQKKTAKAPAAKKAVKEKVAAKASKAKPMTAIEKIYGFVARAKNGIDVETLMKKTGYNSKKVYNVLYKLKKQNKIKSLGRGKYAKS